MAPHSSTLAWKIPWMEEPGRLQSMGLLRVRHDWATSLSLFTFMHWRRKWQPTSVLAWRIPGTEEPSELPSIGLHRVGHDWSDLAAVAAAQCRCLFFFLILSKNVSCTPPNFPRTTVFVSIISSFISFSPSRSHSFFHFRMNSDYFEVIDTEVSPIYPCLIGAHTPQGLLVKSWAHIEWSWTVGAAGRKMRSGSTTLKALAGSARRHRLMEKEKTQIPQ